MSTPSPWEVHNEGSVRVCKPSPTHDKGCYQVAEAEILGINRDTAVANAKIIAIAPELIEACIALLNSTDYCSDTRPLMQAVRNAVAKVVKNEI